ncbi:MAG: helix-turn-helix transcriptional regulator [Candidatus Heimdallarchaeota archaeon]|nr:helix-turn-helix transcriptional regulator [Candidatus Heimdallarchaeota archaeon]MCK5143812.1 helix-turn-helix transcriptional regulator [Candidatus Heimdallarchaeota archaeon]
MPIELTTAELSILGLLSEGENHGYGLNEALDHRGFRNWTDIAFSSIYAILNRLEKKKLIVSKADKKESGRGPARNKYCLTKEGYNFLLSTIRFYISVPESPQSKVDLGAAYIDLLGKEEAINCLEEYYSSLHERLEQIEKTRKRQEPLPFGAQIIFDHGRIIGEAELKWVKRVIKQLKESDGK